MSAHDFQSRLLELMNYDKSTGVFTWAKRRPGVKTGSPLGCDNGSGYLRITVDGESYYAHRLAWVYVTGQNPDGQIDHVNGNRSDNRFDNLRLVSGSENQFNRRGSQANSQSGILGVSWHRKAGKWQAHISAQGKKRYLGLFPSQEQAEYAYRVAKAEIHIIKGVGYAGA